jgi:hypothetical protein
MAQPSLLYCSFPSAIVPEVAGKGFFWLAASAGILNSVGRLVPQATMPTLIIAQNTSCPLTSHPRHPELSSGLEFGQERVEKFEIDLD